MKNSDETLVYYIIESDDEYNTECLYFNKLYSSVNKQKRIKDNLKSPCEYFEFPIFKNIITKDPVSKNNVDKLFKEIHDEIIEKNYLKNSNRLIIFILMDNDVQSN